MIEFKTITGRTVFMDIEAVWAVEETTGTTIHETEVVDIWHIHTKGSKTFEVEREIALGIVDIVQACTDGIPYPGDSHNGEESTPHFGPDGEEITPPPHTAEDDEDEPIEDWEKDPDDWKGNEDVNGNS